MAKNTGKKGKGGKGKGAVKDTAPYMHFKVPMSAPSATSMDKAGLGGTLWADDWYRPPGGGAPVVTAESLNHVRAFRATGNTGRLARGAGRVLAEVSKGTYGEGAQADKVADDATWLLSLVKAGPLDKRQIKKLDKVAKRWLEIAYG